MKPASAACPLSSAGSSARNPVGPVSVEENLPRSLASFCRHAVHALVGGTMLAGLAFAGSTAASAETRTLNLYYTHTGESARITFKKDGRFIPSGLRQLNQFLRDWRRNEATRMDPALFDLIWEVYQKSGSHSQIRIVSAYRSPATNNMLRRRTRGVAKNSQHTYGKAMDFFLPDVPLATLRAIGLRMQVGGVGFYPTANSPFVHMDTGSVRHWPRMTRSQLVQVFPNGHTLHVPSDGKPLPGFDDALADYEARKNGERRAIAAIGSDKGGGSGGGGLFAMFRNQDDSQVVRGSSGKKSFLAALFGGGADEEEDNAASTGGGGDEEGAAPATPAKAPAAAPAAPAAATAAAAAPAAGADQALPGVRNGADTLPGASLTAAPATRPAPADDDETPAAVPPPAKPAVPAAVAVASAGDEAAPAAPKGFVTGPAGLSTATPPDDVPVAVVPVARPDAPQTAADDGSDDAGTPAAAGKAAAMVAGVMPLPAPDRTAPAGDDNAAVAMAGVMPVPRPEAPAVAALAYAGGTSDPLSGAADGDVLAATARQVMRGSRMASTGGAVALPPATQSQPTGGAAGFVPAMVPTMVLPDDGTGDPLAFLGGSAGVPAKTDTRLLSASYSVRGRTFANLSAPDYRSLPALLAPTGGVVVAPPLAPDAVVMASSAAVDHFSGAGDVTETAALR